MRIIIDCTGMNFAGLPSGILRVVYNYVKFGFEWGHANDVEIIPVYVEEGFARVVEEIPGIEMPQYVDSYYNNSYGRFLTKASRSFYRAGKLLYQIPYFIVRRPTALLFPWITRDATHDWLRFIRNTLTYPSAMILRRYELQGKLRYEPDDILFCPASWYDKDSKFYVDTRKEIRALAILNHDILPVTNPEYYNYPWSASFSANVLTMLKTADVFFTVSRFTRDSILREFPREAAKMQFCVAYNGLDVSVTGAGDCIENSPNVALIAAKCTMAPYLMVGSVEPKKGHLLVLSVLEKLWDEGKTRRKLLIIGRRAWLSDRIVAKLETTRHMDNIVWLENATDNDVRYAYQRCHALIFASVNEGFGLPLIECATSGRPIITRSSEVTREVIGRFGVYFDGSYTDLVEKILLMEDENGLLYREKKAELRNLSWPRWDCIVPGVFSALLKYVKGEAPLPSAIWPENAGLPCELEGSRSPPADYETQRSAARI